MHWSWSSLYNVKPMAANTVSECKTKSVQEEFFHWNSCRGIKILLILIQLVWSHHHNMPTTVVAAIFFVGWGDRHWGLLLKHHCCNSWSTCFGSLHSLNNWVRKENTLHPKAECGYLFCLFSHQAKGSFRGKTDNRRGGKNAYFKFNINKCEFFPVSPKHSTICPNLDAIFCFSVED